MIPDFINLDLPMHERKRIFRLYTLSSFLAKQWENTDSNDIPSLLGRLLPSLRRDVSAGGVDTIIKAFEIVVGEKIPLNTLWQRGRIIIPLRGYNSHDYAVGEPVLIYNNNHTSAITYRGSIRNSLDTGMYPGDPIGTYLGMATEEQIQHFYRVFIPGDLLDSEVIGQMELDAENMLQENISFDSSDEEE